MNIVLTGFCGYIALAVIIFCIFYTMAHAFMYLHDMWILRKWKKNNINKQQLINKACEWLADRVTHDSIDYPMATVHLIDDFRKTMEDYL